MRVDAGTSVDDDIVKIFPDLLADIHDLLHRCACKGVLRCAKNIQVACHRHLGYSIQGLYPVVKHIPQVVLDLALHAENDINTAQTEIQFNDQSSAALLCKGVPQSGTDGGFARAAFARRNCNYF